MWEMLCKVVLLLNGIAVLSTVTHLVLQNDDIYTKVCTNIHKLILTLSTPKCKMIWKIQRFSSQTLQPIFLEYKTFTGPLRVRFKRVQQFTEGSGAGWVGEDCWLFARQTWDCQTKYNRRCATGLFLLFFWDSRMKVWSLHGQSFCNQVSRFL